MNVYRTGVTEIIKAPNLVKKLVSGENSVVVGCEEVEKLKLLGRDVNRLARKLKLVLLKAYLYIVKLDNVVVALIGVRLITAKHSLNAGGKLL